MAESPTDLGTSRADERALHGRLLAGDPVAPSDLIVVYLGPLLTALRRRFWREDPHLVETAAHDSLLTLGQRPARYDPERGRGGLLAYLLMDADRDVRNALQSETRKARRRAPLEDVEVGPRARKLSMEAAEDPLERMLGREAVDWERFAALMERLDARERVVVELMIDGERRSEVYGAAIGSSELPKAELAREVKRWKDRLQKRLRRWYEREGRDG